tara:strand:- start:448 stop:660 length:213 start_codon:yes stop_codon:yes gene_type:complete
LTGADLQHVVALELHEVLQDFIQQTAVHTPQQKTPTKTAFNTKSIASFQQLQFLQSIKTPFLIYSLKHNI